MKKQKVIPRAKQFIFLTKKFDKLYITVNKLVSKNKTISKYQLKDYFTSIYYLNSKGSTKWNRVDKKTQELLKSKSKLNYLVRLLCTNKRNFKTPNLGTGPLHQIYFTALSIFKKKSQMKSMILMLLFKLKKEKVTSLNTIDNKKFFFLNSRPPINFKVKTRSKLQMLKKNTFV